MDGCVWTIGLLEAEADDGERREVTCSGSQDGSLLVAEASEGPLTDLLFGGSPRTHRVHVAREGLISLGWALGALEPCGTGEDILPFIGLFFGGGETFLSDLMDLLDRSEVPYSYMSRTASGDLCFRPAAITASCGAS